MIASRESKKGTDEGESTNVVPISKVERRKRAGTAVCIRKGRLLFLPTAPVLAPPPPPPPNDTKAKDSKGN
jgi:hypothetical protein